MRLSDFLTEFVNNHEYGIRSSTCDVWYKPAIADLRRFLNREPTLGDLTRETINRWLAWKVEAGCPPATVRTRRNAILALWRAAFEADHVDDEPKKIRKVRVPAHAVEAWTRQEMNQLLAHMSGFMPDKLLSTGLSKRLYFRSLALAAWDTGLRLGDLLSMEREWIRDVGDRGRISVLQRKTQRLVHCHFSSVTMREINRLMVQQPDRRLIWPLWCRREQFYKTFRGFVRGSGIRKGTFKWIRRASATAVELERPGHGYKHAGHSDPRVTNAHYIDRSQFDDEAGPEPLAC